jgi:hypothetical protein
VSKSLQHAKRKRGAADASARQAERADPSLMNAGVDLSQPLAFVVTVGGVKRRDAMQRDVFGLECLTPGERRRGHLRWEYIRRVPEPPRTTRVRRAADLGSPRDTLRPRNT